MVECFIIKKNDMKKILFPILLLMIVLISCDQDNEGPLFDTKGIDYVAVGVTAIEAPYALNNENGYSIMFPIHRSDKSKSGTVANLSLEGSDLFELESSTLTFEEGSGLVYAKVITLDNSALDPAMIYSFTLTVTGDNASLLYNTAEFSAQLELSLSSLGTGAFTSTFFEDNWGVEVLKADGLEIYKVMGLYEEGSDILIIENAATGTVSIPDQKAWYHSAGYQVYVKGTGSVSVNGDGKKVYSMDLEHFIPDVINWGAWPEVLVFP